MKNLWIIEVESDTLEQAERVMQTIKIDIPQGVDVAMGYFGQMEES
ncbi:hypothetical protein PBI_LUCKY2013_203 [Mycobacterium phage Lucky2013]|nr:hypothetical protein PORCELAIN_206 [Mycobacterium phage Porcelain]ASD53594.1 hypothetical protein PBI_LUCKY2013_203 [Mycobacterium phage Lucky2013]QQM15350.1 hypothetical protein SEA_POUND_195 [Mycobacterium phage Pound]